MQINTHLITNENNFMRGRQGQSGQDIIIHTNGAKGTDLFNWFQNNTIQVSAHYQIYLTGQIDQYASEDDTAYHAGVWEENLRSIGIEHEDDGNPNDSTRTDAQYESSAQLIADIYRRHGLPFNDMGRIKPHNEFVPTRSCPAGLSIDRIRTRVNQILNVTEDPNMIAELQQEITAYQIDQANKDKTIASLNSQISILTAQDLQKDSQIADLQKENSDLQTQVNNAVLNHQQDTTTINGLSIKVTDLESQIGALQLQIKNLQSQSLVNIIKTTTQKLINFLKSKK